MSEQQPLPDLDDPRLYEETDPQGARQRLFDLAGQCQAAWDLAMAWRPPALPLPPRAVVIVGMGGSAIGGDLLRALAAPLATVPLLLHRDYGLPAYVGPPTPVFASSYSGDTEETLSAAMAAHRRGAPVIAVTTGGRLARLAGEQGWSILPFSYPAQPREALGYSLMLLLGALVRLELLPDPTPEVRPAVAALRSLAAELAPDRPRVGNPAKELAGWLYGHLALLCGSGLMAPVARRWKCQINEASKAWACAEELPEMDHNAITGTAHPPAFANRVRALFLASKEEHPRNAHRREITRQVLEEAGVAGRTLLVRGGSPLVSLLSGVLWGDAVAYYLAMLYRADPTPIAAITALKEALGQVPEGQGQAEVSGV